MTAAAKTDRADRALRFLVLGTLAINLALHVLGAAGCGTTRAAVVRDVRQCADSSIAAGATNLEGAVSGILQQGAPDWQAQLAALETLGVNFVVCAVAKVAADLAAGLDANGQIPATAAVSVERGGVYLGSPLNRARSYLAARQVAPDTILTGERSNGR